MNELLPIALGAWVAVLLHAAGRKTSPARIAFACVGVGLLAAFVNQELAAARWQIFVGVDAALCAIGYLAMAGLLIRARRSRHGISGAVRGNRAVDS